MASIDEIQIGVVVSFKSKNTTDPNTYYGMVQGFFTYDLVRPYFDVDAYHNSVANIVGVENIPPKEELRYFVLRVPDTKELVYFALEWIDENTLEIIEKEGKLNIDVLNVNEGDIDTIVSILASNGYTALVRKFDEDIHY